MRDAAAPCCLDKPANGPEHRYHDDKQDLHPFTSVVLCQKTKLEDGFGHAFTLLILLWLGDGFAHLGVGPDVLEPVVVHDTYVAFLERFGNRQWDLCIILYD